ncbi:hypothetical protein [Hahella ganghwensis]|uniref:hypothetical protein n=1 Tax=Hahella ganghwensis TaxID=286420 RepID=UPI00035CCD91|nr:hypothetical protein [Hahella ganghwensis]
MKEHHLKHKFEAEAKRILESSHDLTMANNLFRAYYDSMLSFIPCGVPFQVEIIDTESIRYSVYYQSCPSMSEQALMITNVGYDAYLWMEDGGWVLDDDYYSTVEIAKALAETPLLNKIPENIRELKKLLDDGYWVFSPEQFPKFNDQPPCDTTEVLSWDDNYILTGTKSENMAIMTRNDWDKLCDREANW